MAGRIGAGERWRFRTVASETTLRQNHRPVFLDRFQLVPAAAPKPARRPDLPDYVGTGLYIGEDAGAVAAGLRRDLPGAGVDQPASQLAIVRTASASGPEFHRAAASFRRCVQDCSLTRTAGPRSD
jgi:urease accessory protein UreH